MGFNDEGGRDEESKMVRPGEDSDKDNIELIDDNDPLPLNDVGNGGFYEGFAKGYNPGIKSGLLKVHCKLSDYFTKFGESPTILQYMVC